MSKRYGLFVVAATVVIGCGQKGAPDQPLTPVANNTPTTSTSGTSTAPTAGTTGTQAPTSSTPAPTTGTTTGTASPTSTAPTRQTAPSPATGSPSGSPVTNRPYRPEMPKAEVSVSGSYEAGGSKIEVEGGCKITEESVSCWKADGSDNPDLATKVKTAFIDPNGYGTGSFQIKYGKKNRVIVFKTTRPASGGNGTNLSLTQLGDSYDGGSYINLNLNPTDSRMEPNQPYVRYEARSVTAESSDSTTKARLNVSEMVPDRADIPCKVGSSGVLGGWTFTLTAIEPYKPDPNRYMGMPNQGPQWQLVFKRSGSSTRPVQFFAAPKDASGNPISFVSPTGDPVSQGEYSKAMQATYTKRDPGAYAALSRKYRSASAFQSSYAPSAPDKIVIMTAVNPKKIDKLSLGGSFNKIVEITGIRLDGN